MLNRSSVDRGGGEGFLEFMENNPVLKDVTRLKRMFPVQGMIVGQAVRRPGFLFLICF